MLNFILKTNDEELINEMLEYTINNDIIRFRHNNETYKFNLNNNLFIKLNKDTKISIDINNLQLIIELLDLDQKFFDGLELIEKNIDSNNISFKYKLLDEDEKINEIIIKY